MPGPPHTVTSNKVWKNAISGDTATISAGDLTGSATAVGGDSEQGGVVSGEFDEGQSVQLGEALGQANKGDYTATTSCPGADVTKDGAFTMPASDVTCTYTNTNASPSIPLTPVTPPSLANTGSSVPVVGLFGAAGGLFALSALALLLMWHRRRDGLAE